MSFRVVIDSCGELTDEMKASGCFKTASLMLQVDDHNIIDDESFDQADFLRRVAASPNCPKSSCPSPEAYRAAFDCDADHVFAVTLSSKLSGSYNSAVLGMNLLKEEKPDAKVYIFDSRSASIGETLIGLKIQECEEQGLPFEEIIDKVEAYIDSQMTWFVLENLETLRKNGRLSKVKAFVATALRIKPVMVSTPEGEIAYLPNPHLQENLAFCFQMQLACGRYPGFARKIYLKGLRYNLHLRGRSSLIEAGAQTNTKKEVWNAMELLAEVVDTVLDPVTQK